VLCCSETPVRRGSDKDAQGLGQACFGLKSFLVGAVIKTFPVAGMGKGPRCCASPSESPKFDALGVANLFPLFCASARPVA
jgi:hypothetical protein